jgi:hypothetical protein
MRVSSNREDVVSTYLIEMPHAPEECPAAEGVPAATGRPSLNAYRGCGDGRHTTWIVAELADERDAWSLVPRLLRDTARVTRVDRVPDSGSAEGTTGGHS